MWWTRGHIRGTMESSFVLVVSKPCTNMWLRIISLQTLEFCTYFKTMSIIFKNYRNAPLPIIFLLKTPTPHQPSITQQNFIFSWSTI